MKPFAIRSFMPADGPAVLALHRRSILATGDQFYTDAERQSWAAGMTAEGYGSHDGEHIEVAVDAGSTPIAFCSQNGEHIVALYVDPDWQGEGAGAALLARAESRIAAAGLPVARVHSSLPAVGFYQHQGYRVVEGTNHQTRGGLVLASTRLEKVIG